MWKLGSVSTHLGGALLRTLRAGLVAAIGLAVVSDIPVLGAIVNFPGLNWMIWIGLWAWLADRFVRQARAGLTRRDNPSMLAMGAGALVGAVSGFAGQLSQIVLQLLFVAVFAHRAEQTGSVVALAAGTGAAFSLLGSFIALFAYPAFGGFWGGLFGLIWGMRLPRPAADARKASDGRADAREASTEASDAREAKHRSGQFVT